MIEKPFKSDHARSPTFPALLRTLCISLSVVLPMKSAADILPPKDKSVDKNAFCELIKLNTKEAGSLSAGLHSTEQNTPAPSQHAAFFLPSLKVCVER
jgi:hypothetical protein